MFTGIVTDLGTVREVQPLGDGNDMRLVIGTSPAFLAQPAPAVIGASIACSGCCLTAVQLGGDWFAVDASAESLSKTTLGLLRAGSRINLERSLRLGDELGGHLVSGHVDGVAEVLSAVPENGSRALALPAAAGPVALRRREGVGRDRRRLADGQRG